jgi:hypothetical protein
VFLAPREVVTETHRLFGRGHGKGNGAFIGVITAEWPITIEPLWMREAMKQE